MVSSDQLQNQMERAKDAAGGRPQVAESYDGEKVRIRDVGKAFSDFVFTFKHNQAMVGRQVVLNGTEHRVLIEAGYMMSRGNTVKLSQKGVAEALGLTKSQVSRAFKGLRERGLLLEDAYGHLFINYLYEYKGSPKDLVHGIGHDRLAQSRQALNYVTDLRSVFRGKSA